jgi:uncharacterized protein
MRRLLIIPILFLTLMVGNPVFSADFQKGLAAYKSADYATALREWTPLAEQGDSSAQYNLGVMYAKGQGVLQDYKPALLWFALAAQQGNISAQYDLGHMYEEGRGVPQDYKTAVKWYRLSAKQGDAIAQYNLGVMYAKGQGVLQDYVRAHMWFNIAASSGKSKNSSKNRDIVAKRMNSNQIEKAQKLARECVKKNYKGC